VALTVRITAILPNGTAELEDGRRMQLVVSRTGAIGVVPEMPEDRVAELDQVVTHQRPSQGQFAAAPKNHFDTSGLDQG
jgi:hypothetical protein